MHPDRLGDQDQGPSASRRRFALLGLAMVLLGCRGGPAPDLISPTATPPTDWFCESIGAEWDCVEEEDGKLVRRQPEADLRQRPVAGIGESVPRAGPQAGIAAGEPAIRTDQPGSQRRQGGPEPSRSETASPRRGASGLASLHRNAQTAPRRRAETPGSASEADLPAYRRLAFRPDAEVAFTDLPDEYYAVQLLALASPEAVERFVAGAKVPGLAAARVESDGRLFYVLLLGIYRDRPAAVRAAESAPAELEHLTPWIRPLYTLKQAMLRADELAASRAPSD